MKEFFAALNEYPWTSLFVAIFIIICISLLTELVGTFIRKK